MQNNSLYADFEPFTTCELKQHIGLYILNGISPRPKIDLKFVNSKIDPSMIYEQFHHLRQCNPTTKLTNLMHMLIRYHLKHGFQGLPFHVMSKFINLLVNKKEHNVANSSAKEISSSLIYCVTMVTH